MLFLIRFVGCSIWFVDLCCVLLLVVFFTVAVVLFIVFVFVYICFSAISDCCCYLVSNDVICFIVFFKF